MSYTHRLFSSIADVPAHEWQEVHDAGGDAFTDPQFVRLVEEQLRGLSETAVVLVYNAAGRPAAGVCLCTVRLDVMMEAPRALRRVVDAVRKLWPSFLKWNVVLTGLPVTVEQQKLCLLPSADRSETVRQLAHAAEEFARRTRAAIISYGDFLSDDQSWTDAFLQHGYHRGGSHPSHYLDLKQPSFAEYLASMRSNYRTDVQHDINLLDQERVRIEVLDDDAKQAEPITAEFYEFYLQLLQRVDFQLVTLPREFFNAYIARFGNCLDVMRAYVDGKPAGFAISGHNRGMYQLMKTAVDESLSRRFAIYANLCLLEIGTSLSRGVGHISLGTTADEFKLRLGSRPRGRILYVKARGLLALPFRLLAKVLVPDVPTPAAKRVFRENPLTNSRKQRKAA